MKRCRSCEYFEPGITLREGGPIPSECTNKHSHITPCRLCHLKYTTGHTPACIKWISAKTGKGLSPRDIQEHTEDAFSFLMED